MNNKPSKGHRMVPNRLERVLGTEYPLILGPMRLITLVGMAAAVSNSGWFRADCSFRAFHESVAG